MIRQALIKYLNNTFPLVRITNLPKFEEINTPLFSLKKFNDNLYFSFDINKIPSLSLLRYVEELDYKLKMENNKIPLRWYYILQEFYLPDLKFIHQYYDYTDKVNKLTDLVINNIVTDATNIKISRLIVKNENWKTRDYIYAKSENNQLVNNFFEKSKNYQSLDGHYRYLAACEGGLLFNNTYVEDFINLNHSQYRGSIRNEVKGENSYITGKDITPEELMVLHLIMKKEGIDNEFIL